MSAILYSENKNNINDLRLFKLSGGYFSENFTSLGYFAASTSTTKERNSSIFLEKDNGYFLADCYNHDAMKKLNDNLSNNIEIIKTFKGEYSFVYVNETHIFFGTDCFGQRPLWFYFNEVEKNFSACSIPKVIEDKHGQAWSTKGNIIYVIDKMKYKIKMVTNKVWDLTQKHNHYDYVFENFEKSIRKRHEDEVTIYPLSSGIDSGAINCAAISMFDNVQTVTYLQKCSSIEKEILRGRIISDDNLVVHLNNPSEVLMEKNDISDGIIRSEFFHNDDADQWINLCKKISNKKIIMTGVGGDALYGVWYDKTNGKVRSPVNKSFPHELTLVWPWHTYQARLSTALSKLHFISGYFGLETRNPLLDDDLFQSWINTTQVLKNQDHKAWLKKYMKAKKYSY
jgi:asparagine synthetase B (glutamine-hydrolysing)